MTNERRVVGSTTAVDEDDRRKKKAGWLPWALLGLGALALLVFLVLRNAGDEGDDAGLDATDEASSSADEGGDVGSDGDATGDELTDGGDGSGGDGEDGGSGGDDGSSSTTTGAGGGAAGASSATTAAGSGAAGASGGAAGGGASGSDAAPQQGTITSEGTPILPTPAEGLGAFADKGAEARGVLVQSVVADEGFWVGATEADRLFVFFAADNAGTESRVQVEQGQTISFDAVVKPLPADFAPAFGMDEDEGTIQLEGQGHYLEIAPDAVSLG